MSKREEQIREQLIEHRPKNWSSGYPVELKRSVGAWIRENRAIGKTWQELARSIGISGTTASKWAQLTKTGTFKPIELVESIQMPKLTTSKVLFIPGGYRIEGLDNCDIIEILKGIK